MQCKICKCKFEKKDGGKTRNGFICKSCFDILPESIKRNIEKFTVRQIFQFSKIIYPQSGKAWAECGILKVSRDGISVNKVEFKFKDLRMVKLNFHPKSMGPTEKTAIGTITIIIETKSPHFIIEEPFFPDDVTVNYVINGSSIHYFYSYEMEKLILAIQKCLDNNNTDIAPYIEEYYKAVCAGNKGKEKQRDDEHTINGSEKKENNQEMDDGYNPNTLQKNKKNLSPFEEAKQMFGVDIPYTEDQIRKKRNVLIKKYHPDNPDGSEDMCRQINKAYKLLMKFVV